MDLTSYLLGKEAGGGGGTPTLQSKEVEITENGQTTVTADSGYDGLSSVAVTTNVQGGGDLNEYFNDTITENGTESKMGKILIRKVPTFYVASNVTSIESMFANATNLIEFEGITGGAGLTTIAGLFSGCSNLEKVNLNGIDLTTLKSFYNIFQNCTKLSEINMNQLNTKNVTGMSRTFYGCRALKNLDLSNWKTSSVTTMMDMFAWCNSLEHLDIRNFTFDTVSNYSSMFQQVPANCEIIVKSDTEKTWITSNFSNLTNVKTVAEL